MSTYTDGAPPSVSSGMRNGPDGQQEPSPVPAAGPHDPPQAAGDHTDPPEPAEPSSGPVWLQAEIRRRMEVNRSAGGGRHARREGVDRPGIEDYLGRDDEPGPGVRRPASPPAAPESDNVPPPGRPEASPAIHRPPRPAWMARTDTADTLHPPIPPEPATPPARILGTSAPQSPSGIPEPDPGPPTADLTSRDDPATPTPTRVRIVLSERKASAARSVRTVVDVQELTPVGDLLRTNLIGSQLGAALRVAAVAGLVLAVLPALFALFPELGRMSVLGLRLPWLLLGVLVYPFLLGLGWWYVRSAERAEQEFADHVQD
ncbi:hypothetical protein [Pseudonocardia asaccharolytica]|uniref:DUF485 domain-containing protein n=1 Tax=Pseudonocardia asaccharolytica DSM 44247 = NBRC 16224 TaxID=1123024 RepID=A0A511CV76_9PSEU|nr:hypothetical protein [Pseudonocardia asaccharolytica]GEL16451.1 hypothetical protein PA7_02880 [Pseudonocardia asaccharolytica DSM 44247 = NBRC 16224]